MQRLLRCVILVAVTIAGTIAAVFTARTTEAAVNSTGRHQACVANVAVRERPDGPARDNLKKGQTFVVTKGVGGHYVYGYKLVNGLHGWVLSSQIDKSCR